ncbi:MAG TPA: hypothetical protein VFM30_05055 [Steroidobacteraceae bacterium]|jgi:hypothetical protein|nr:hypothetical protein [Steroidobacteraceae bacterium]
MAAGNDDPKRDALAPAARAPAPVPLLSADEREFWRRAVAAERARQRRCDRPAPFPFQPA